MPKVRRILSDDQKHQDAEPQDEREAETVFGHEPATGSDKAEEDTLTRAQETGLYEDQDEEHPGEVNIAKEVEKDEKGR